jgi:hypothetical protein
MPLAIDRPRATIPAKRVQPAMVLKRSVIEGFSARVFGFGERSSVEGASAQVR